MLADLAPVSGVYGRQLAGLDALYRAEVARCRQEPGADVRWTEAATSLHDVLPWEECYALWRQAEALLHAGATHREAASDALRRCHALARDLEAVPVLDEVAVLARTARVPLAEPATPLDPTEPAHDRLTAREREVLAHIVAGRTYGEIARALVLSEKTVSSHVSHLLAKTGTVNRVDLAGWATRRRPSWTGWAAMPAAPPTDATRLPDLLADRLAGPDEVYTVFAEWAERQGTPLYPHQDEAVLALLAGENVVLSTPTGSGKSLVATAAHLSALSSDRVSFYTAPIKALVSEKFFALCEVFGPSEVGMLTGDASVNPDAPIICCTAEILANITLREGSSADVGLVVMDEFHYYAEPDRGWAWQVPLLDLPQAQFLLMSATLGDVRGIADDLGRRTGRATTLVTGTERPVPLSFSWALTPLPETIEELLTTHQAPVYVVHFTQAAALEQAQALLALKGSDQGRPRGDRRADRGFRFTAGFGRTLSRLVRAGIGVHHAGMLPRYRRLVEQLAQDGLLKVVCGTDTLGVGINVPIRTVLFTGLVKFDGSRQRVLRAREFHQIAGRAGRAGFDTSGAVVVQPPSTSSRTPGRRSGR